MFRRKENKMSVMTKILALITCLFVLCGCFVSCKNNQQGEGGNSNVNDNNNEGDGTGEGNGDGGEGEEISTDRYVATVKTVYATQDFRMKDAIAAIGSPVTTVSVDGDTIKIASSSQANDISTKTDYVYIDGVLYYASEVSVGELSASAYKKANMSADQKAALLSKVGPGTSIGIGDFSDHVIEPYGDLTIYTCSGILEEAGESLCDIFASKFAGLNAVVRLADATYYVETVKGVIDNSIISCNFVITMDGIEYEVTMHLYYDYDYNAEFSISAPQDSDKYLNSSIEEILG